jgi:hypothetical protein
MHYRVRISLLYKACISKKIGLFHDSNEFLFVNLSVSISVSLVNHLLKLFISHSFSQLSCYSLQIFKRNLSSIVVIEKSKSLKYFFSWISLCNFSSHQFHKISKLDDSFSLSVNFCNHFLDFFLLRLKSKCSHSNFKFFGINIS